MAIRNSEWISFTTEQARIFQGYITPLIRSHKTIVIPNILPIYREKLCLKSRFKEKYISYVGSFYGSRRPDELLLGYSKYLAEGGDAVLRFIGTSPAILTEKIKKFGLSNRVEILPFQSDVTPFLHQSTILIAVDSFEAPPVYLSTKLVEYLSTAVHILLISPDKSPGSLLIRKTGGGICVKNDPDDIANAIFVLMNDRRSHVERGRLLFEMFGPLAVARKLKGALCLA